MSSVLVVNAGSSSLKFQVFSTAAEGPTSIIRGQVDGIGTRPRLRATRADDTVLADQGYEPGQVSDLIAWAPTRAQAARRLATALGRARLHGLTTNRDLLVATLRDEAFLAGQVSTSFLETRATATGPLEPHPHLLLAGAVALAEEAARKRPVQRGLPVAWRNVVSQPQRTVFAVATGATGEVQEHTVEWYGGRGYASADGSVTVLEAAPDGVTIEVDGIATRVDVTLGAVDAHGARGVYVDSALGSLSLRALPRFVDPADVVAQGSLLAPMPGSVVSVAASDGQGVSAGDPILVLEAMKMQHTINAPTDGVVSDLVAVGDQVAAGDVLAVVSPDQTDQTDQTDQSEEDA